MFIVDDVLSQTTGILSLRDKIGAVKEPVYILTRKWVDKKGMGQYFDTTETIYPTPYVVDYSHKLGVREGGAVRQGDILLKTISKQKYTEESMIDCSVTDDKTEKFYMIKNRLYEVISVTQEYVYWNVQIRKTIKRI